MSKKPIEISGFVRVMLCGLLLAVIAAAISAKFNGLSLVAYPITVPRAYRVPKIPGGTPLRMAMVHDVLHERYLRHGDAWYRQRNIQVRKVIESSAPLDQRLDAMDDLAVGLERLGQFDAAIAVMRRKLEQLSPSVALGEKSSSAPSEPTTRSDRPMDHTEFQDLQNILAAQNLSPADHAKYTTYANLGTILVHQSMRKAMAGDNDAKAKVQEALECIERAIAINPGSHFGRERWQAIVIEDLLAMMEHPDLLGKYDVIGNSLSKLTSDDPIENPSVITRNSPFPSDEQIGFDRRLSIRRAITELGIDKDWAKVVHPDYGQPMPFDEPTLGIIGMWTMGGGPNPHFALALGRIMENVGQRSIAWNAYERAVEMQNSFWPDDKIKMSMVKYCGDRQDAIAKIESKDPASWQTHMRQQHQQELAWGTEYQNAYHSYEAAQITAGVELDGDVRLDDPTFYDGFFKGRPAIASNPGLADDFLVTHKEATTFSDAMPPMVLGFGVGMFLAVTFPEKKK